MDLVPYLSAVILIATIATIVLAVFSYLAFKVRNRRMPRAKGPAPLFFRRVELASVEGAEPDP